MVFKQSHLRELNESSVLVNSMSKIRHANTRVPFRLLSFLG